MIKVVIKIKVNCFLIWKNILKLIFFLKTIYVLWIFLIGFKITNVQLHLWVPALVPLLWSNISTENSNLVENSTGRPAFLPFAFFFLLVGWLSRPQSTFTFRSPLTEEVLRLRQFGAIFLYFVRGPLVIVFCYLCTFFGSMSDFMTDFSWIWMLRKGN